VLSGRGLCDELITRPEESYRLCCVVVCDLETSRMGAPYIYDICGLRVKGLFFIMHMKRVFWDVGTEILTLIIFVIQRVKIIQLALNPLAVGTWDSYQ